MCWFLFGRSSVSITREAYWGSGGDYETATCVLLRGILGCLEIFPFRFYGWGNDHCGAMHFFDSSKTTDSHASAQGTDQILSAVGN